MISLRSYLPENIILDPLQEEIITKFDKLLCNQKKSYKFLNRVFKHQVIPQFNGIYLHGTVGRGKTMLMKAFFAAFSNNKKIYHFQDLMQTIHKQLYELKALGGSNYDHISKISINLAKSCKLICIDELEVKDIADAMVIGKLIKELTLNQIFIFFTSNTKPMNLYKDGLQRESFLPFIDFIEKSFMICALDDEKDYRLQQMLNESRRILSPNTTANNQTLNNIANQMIKCHEICEAPKNFGRQINLIQSYENILITSFEELCQQDLSYADYVVICQRYKVIFLFDVPRIDEQENNLILRLINFIDNAYFYKVALFATFADAPSNIYPKGQKINEFQRTISRLNEMNSEVYSSSLNNN